MFADGERVLKIKDSVIESLHCLSSSDESAPWCKWGLYSMESALLSNDIRRQHWDSWESQSELTVSYIMCDAGSDLFSLWVTTSQNTSHEWWDIYHRHFLHLFNEAEFEGLLWEQVFRENLIIPSQHFIYILNMAAINSKLLSNKVTW